MNVGGFRVTETCPVRPDVSQGSSSCKTYTSLVVGAYGSYLFNNLSREVEEGMKSVSNLDLWTETVSVL